MKKNTFLSFVCALILTALALPALEAPDFTTQDMNGRTIQLSQLRGKVVLLDFWATWCPPCRQEVPAMIDIANSFKYKNLVIIGISLDRNMNLARTFVQQKGMNWTHIMDLKACQQIAQLYNVEAIPYTMIIGPDGKPLAENLRGAELKAKLASLL